MAWSSTQLVTLQPPGKYAFDGEYGLVHVRLIPDYVGRTNDDAPVYYGLGFAQLYYNGGVWVGERVSLRTGREGSPNMVDQLFKAQLPGPSHIRVVAPEGTIINVYRLTWTP